MNQSASQPQITPGTDPAGSADDSAVELRREAYTMALYVSVCLLAALTALSESTGRHDVEVIAIVWGTTIGLALAHLFAFRVSARLVGSGSLDRRDAKISIAQLVGALAVAVLSTAPIALFSVTAELDVGRLLLAGFIAVIGYQVARSNGSPRYRALTYAGAMLIAAFAIAIAKNVLSGH